MGELEAQFTEDDVDEWAAYFKLKNEAERKAIEQAKAGANGRKPGSTRVRFGPPRGP